MDILESEKLTIPEAARLSGIDRNVLYELFEDGEITGYQRKSRAKIVIFKESLEEYLKGIQND